mmetsp:Transcript_29308/g.82687  ORF Transcript_29308/g.82687 Transcript_29308/m.82687 type:complete len:228 (+) Transcript_29308:184-867(+)|eukprot:CAMPEP_0117676984 /NCGR_PEP_ID=MMETSP0804-20121206/16503_1 /TAXON_ID=1074897 /ORGANISM="Tetraselmis astigmatica, Strain CCMP880" /LENGTH=227 /DNA_ID=CAMNT_0005486237 /DNA_START=134 /DNA_END=817 /DNA_ORIENTATION=+
MAPTTTSEQQTVNQGSTLGWVQEKAQKVNHEEEKAVADASDVAKQTAAETNEAFKEANEAVKDAINVARQQTAELMHSAADLADSKPEDEDNQEKGMLQRMGDAAADGLSSASDAVMSAGGAAMSMVGLTSGNEEDASDEKTLGDQVDNMANIASEKVEAAQHAVQESFQSAKTSARDAYERAEEEELKRQEAMKETTQGKAGEAMRSAAETLHSAADDVSGQKKDN